MTRGRETPQAVLVGLAALAVYLRTLYPGLVGSGDTPELQFVGRVLGTAHTPGYPLYVVVSHLFSRLPFGTLAFRINLMSALFGAVSAALAFGLARRLGARPAPAAGAALAFAFSRSFWSQATLAEVYTLAATLLLACLCALLTWGRERRDAQLLWAVGWAALAFGHHSSDVVAVLPALVLYVLLTDARVLLRPRLLNAAAALVVLGVAQYGFVLLRTRQGAAYLGARAANLPELLDVMRGGKFAARLLAFDLATLVRERTLLVLGLLRDELGAAGLLLATAGLLLLWRRSRRDALLLALAAGGGLGFALNYDVPDLAVFLLPVVALAWPLAAVGLDALVGALPARLPAAAAAALALAPAAWQLVANFRANDHSQRTFETRYFRAVAEALPDRSAVVSESYTVDQMLRYELLGEGYGARKQVALSGRDEESLAAYRRRGYELFVFERGREELAPRGYRFAPLDLVEAPLSDYLKAQRRGLLLVSAGRHAGAGACSAEIGVTGVAGGLSRAGGDAAELALAAGQPIGETGVSAPVALRAACLRGGGLVEAGGRLQASIDRGVALALLSASGRVLERHELDSDLGLEVPFNRRAFPLYRVSGDPACRDLGHGGFLDVGRETAEGRVLARFDGAAPAEASLVLYAGRDRPLFPRLVAAAGRGQPRLDARAFTGPASPELAAALAADGVAGAAALLREPFVSRLELRVDDAGEWAAATLDLGGPPRQALARARVDRPDPERAQLCALPVGGAELFADRARHTERIGLGQDATPYLGDGWQAAERDGPMEFRWSAAREAELLLPLHRVGSFTVAVTAMPPEKGASVELLVNDTSAGSRVLRPGWEAYEWSVASSAWQVGLNRLLLRVSTLRGPTPGDSRTLGVAVGRVRLRLLAGD